MMETMMQQGNPIYHWFGFFPPLTQKKSCKIFFQYFLPQTLCTFSSQDPFY